MHLPGPLVSQGIRTDVGDVVIILISESFFTSLICQSRDDLSKSAVTVHSQLCSRYVLVQDP